MVLIPYRMLWVLFISLGAFAYHTFVWDLADTMNGLMAVPNLIGLLLLSGGIVKETQDFFDNVYKKERLAAKLASKVA